jgi:hypothetical protein
VLLSDADLRKELEAGRLVLDPWDPAMLQPSSVDVRLDRFFRVFQNSRYTHIDPMLQQDELTTEVEPDGDDPFVLHPGEFVLGSTFETVGLPDDLAAAGGQSPAIGTPVPTIAAGGRWVHCGSVILFSEWTGTRRRSLPRPRSCRVGPVTKCASPMARRSSLMPRTSGARRRSRPANTVGPPGS